MDDIKTLVVRNDLNLPKEQVDKLVKMLQNRTITFLSPEKEAGAFLLFCIGKSLLEISAQLTLPQEVIILTSLQYQWSSKALLLQRQDGGQKTLLDLQKDLTSSILVATLLSAQKQLGDFIAGRIEAKDCKWLPSNMMSLEKLMNMINALSPQTPSPTTVITGQNIQINQNAGGSAKIDADSKLKLLKAIENE